MSLLTLFQLNLAPTPSTLPTSTTSAVAVPDVSTALDICSDALVRLGANPIQSFTEGTPASQICSIVYPKVKGNLLSLYNWKFTHKKFQLARLAAAPKTQWKYQYALPSDRLSNVPFVLYETASQGAPAYKAFEFVGEVVYSDAETLFIDYQGAVLDSQWPAYFTELVTVAIMGEIAFAITGEISEGERNRRAVYGDPATGAPGLLQRAKTRNSQQTPPQRLEDFSLIEARFGGVP